MFPVGVSLLKLTMCPCLHPQLPQRCCGFKQLFISPSSHTDLPNLCIIRQHSGFAALNVMAHGRKMHCLRSEVSSFPNKEHS